MGGGGIHIQSSTRPRGKREGRLKRTFVAWQTVSADCLARPSGSRSTEAASEPCDPKALQGTAASPAVEASPAEAGEPRVTAYAYCLIEESTKHTERRALSGTLGGMSGLDSCRTRTVRGCLRRRHRQVRAMHYGILAWSVSPF